MSYGLYIGKNLTADGIAYLAGYGDEPSSHWLEFIPRQSHSADKTITVGVTPDAEMPGQLSQIAQAPETFRHMRVNYSYYKGTPAPLTNGGLNEYGVAVRDIWSPSRQELIDLTPASQTGPNYSDLAALILQRARTAREAVLLIGELIKTYGHTTYGGNSHLIADSNEAWVVIELAGGAGLWVAERLGPDTIRASRPGYIGEVPLPETSTEGFLYSENLFSFAIEQGWYDPDGSQPFNVNQIYGDSKGKWAGVQWIEQEMHLRSQQPEKITLQDMFWAVRTERLTGDSAGYGQIVPLIDTDYSQLRYLWHTQTCAVAAPFVPVYLGISTLTEEFRKHRYLTKDESAAFMDSENIIGSEAFSTVSQGIESTRSASQVFKRLQNLIFRHYDVFSAETLPLWHALEERLMQDCSTVFHTAKILLQASEDDLATHCLTYFCNTELLNAMEMAEKLAQGYELRTRLLFGIDDGLPPRNPERIW